MPDLNLFIPITKVDAAQRLVYGLATAEDQDRSGEVCDYETTKPFYERWSGEIAKSTGGRSLGNVRAMHGKVAAGKVTAINFNDADKQIEICAKVVDDAEWKKVEEGVYTGFSQGGAYVKRWKDEAGLQRYTADPSEVSLVDLPCLPSATFEMIKADGATEKRHFAAEVTAIEPTNAEVAAKATELAKAAGDETKWSDHVAAARAELVKTAQLKAPLVAAGDATLDTAVEQVWKAKDGTTFAKKADALAHNAKMEAGTAVAAATDPVLNALADISKKLGIEPQSATTAPSAAAEINAALEKAVNQDDVVAIYFAAPADYFDGIPDSAGVTFEKATGLEKRQFSAAERKKAADAGEAMSDGSFPIKTKADLANAVKAYGRAKDPAKAKAHIIARAKALDATDMLPADWDGSTAKAGKSAGGLLEKGLPTVARLACLIEELTWVKAAVHMEAKQENDGSPLPADLLQNITDLCTTLNAMCAEETAELIQGQNVDDLNNVPNVFNMAAKLPDGHLAALVKLTAAVPDLAKVAAMLEKLGARNSKKDKATIQAMHDHSCDLGAACDPDNCPADGDDASKALRAAGLSKVAGELAKMTAERDALEKTMTGTVMPMLEEIAKRLKNIESQPMPLPFAGMPRAVSKTEDSGDPGTAEQQFEKLLETPEGREMISTYMIKLSQRQGQPMALAR